MDEVHELAEQPRSMIGEAISAIREGDVSQSQIARLSDLSRANAQMLAAAWHSIPEGNRIDLVRRLDELSEERVELNFGRVLRIALGDRSAVVRQLAVAGLWEDESSEMLERLRGMLEADESPDVRAQVAAALERFSGKAAAGSLDKTVANELRNDLRRSATDAGAPYSVQRRALESLDSADHGLQCSALYAMGRSQDDRWLPTILEQLDSEEPEIRFEAARAAGLLGSVDALTALLRAARDDDAEVRHEAIRAIAQIGGRGAVRALERLAEDAGEADLELIQAAVDDVNTLLEPLQPSH